MNARLRMYKYCYSNEDAIYAKGLYGVVVWGKTLNSHSASLHPGV